MISAVTKEENARFIGLNAVEAAKRFGYTDVIEFVSDLLIRESGNVAIIIRSMNQDDIDVIAKLPYSGIISDAIYAETDRPHPRMYGAFPHVIRDYVKDRKVLTLEEAVKKMTAIPAARMGVKERGLIKEGYFADINVFDPECFCDKATYTDPLRCAEGLSCCFVNGTLAVKQDQVLTETAGQFFTA